MRNYTKILSLFLVVIVLIATMPMVALADTEKYFSYTVSNGEATITDYTGTATVLHIPSQLDGYRVTHIGDDAFYHCYSLVSVIIPDSVTSIGNSAFSNCSSLIKISIPNSVKRIEEGAFMFCTSLPSVTIPISVEYIGRGAFSCCDSLTEIKIFNPDCLISTDASTINASAVVYGYDNSSAKSYASLYRLTFVSIPCEHSNFTVISNIEATCTESGEIESRCTCCGWLEAVIFPATGHKDKNRDSVCDNCGDILDYCSHICHKSGFMGFIWKILNFFQKLFGINPVCECRMPHY